MKTFESVVFDTDSKTMEIKNGTVGIYPYTEIEKVSVLNEEVKFRGKTPPFSHQVLGGTTFFTIFGGPSCYVGLKVTLKDGKILAIYVSDKIVSPGTDFYRQDHKKAEEIKAFIDKIIQKYNPPQN